MKVMISERQLKHIVSKKVENQDIKEEETTPADAQPTAGTSSTQSGGQGYPEVGKWESGVSREGPANQITVTKWADIVGAKLVRGKSNPLK